VVETFVVRFLAVIGIFVPGVNRQVSMRTPIVELRNERIAVSAILQNPLSVDLLNIIDSGTPVTLTYICRLRTAQGTPTAAIDTTVIHRVVKNLATGSYEINTGTRTLLTSRITEYSLLFRLETVPLWQLLVLSSSGRYYVEVSARFEPIVVQATGQRYDLMALWSYRVPTEQSGIFTRATVEQRRVAP
jgi:hypothetical protein